MRTEMLSKAVVPVVNKLEMEGLLAEGTTDVRSEERRVGKEC